MGQKYRGTGSIFAPITCSASIYREVKNPPRLKIFCTSRSANAHKFINATLSYRARFELSFMYLIISLFHWGLPTLLRFLHFCPSYFPLYFSSPTFSALFNSLPIIYIYLLQKKQNSALAEYLLDTGHRCIISAERLLK